MIENTNTLTEYPTNSQTSKNIVSGSYAHSENNTAAFLTTISIFKSLQTFVVFVLIFVFITHCRCGHYSLFQRRSLFSWSLVVCRVCVKNWRLNFVKIRAKNRKIYRNLNKESQNNEINDWLNILTLLITSKFWHKWGEMWLLIARVVSQFISFFAGSCFCTSSRHC